MPISTQNGKYIYNGVAYNTLQEAKAAEMRDSSTTINPNIPAGTGTPIQPVPYPQVRQPMSDQSMGAALNRMRGQGGLNAMQEARQSKQYGGRGTVGMPQQPTKPSGLLDMDTPEQPQERSFMDKLTSTEGLGSIGAMLLSMSNNPNLQKIGMAEMQNMDAKRTSNRTLEFLKTKGVDDDTLEALKNNPQMINAYAASILKAPKTYAAQENYKMAQSQGFKGSFMDYQREMALASAGVAGEKDFWKEYRGGEAEAIMNLATQSPELKTALGQIQTLRLLGERMDEDTIVPQFLRDSVPKGMSNSIDAYRSMLYSVAQSLRQAGTGPMTDKDFDILVQRAGSESLGLEERRAIQAGLEAAAKMRLDLSMAASEFRRNPSDENLAKFREAEAEILNRPLFNDEQRELLGFDDATMAVQFPDVPEGFIKSLPPAKIEIFKKMPPEDRQLAIEEWRKTQTGR